MAEIIRKVFVVFWDLVESVTFALALVVVTYLFFFQPGEVHGASSYPTWQENERFITSKIAYKIYEPARGDFVVIMSPANSDVDFIKRIVGLPGETIRISNCLVYINGRLLDETPYLQSNVCTRTERYLAENSDLLISSDYYFLMGDNREHSSDSRDFGPIPRASIVGKAVFRYWPLDRAGFIN